MPRYFIELAYKGKHFCGFQKQTEQLTIQGEVEKALSTLTRGSIETLTSSRTDSGVHALQNYLHLDTSTILNEKTVYNANALLHKDIVIKSIRQVSPAAHSRFDALSRSYEYIIYQEKNPFLSSIGYFYPFALNIEKLHQSAKIFLENDNFQSFCKRHTEVNNYLCKLTKVAWTERNGYLKFSVTGNRFLRGMVRALVGTSLQIARGKVSLENLHEIIKSNDCQQADFSAIAKGLKLISVEYPDDIFL